MSKETLHTLRLIIPGLLLLIILVSLLHGDQGFFDITISVYSLRYLIVVFGFGVLFYVFNPRMYLMKNSLNMIKENIKDKLIAPFTMDPDIKNSITNLRVGDKLINIYYHFVDKDDTLSARAQEVYFNGLIWSSLVDLVIIGLIGAIIYFVVFLITKNMSLVLYWGIAIGVCILSSLLIPLVVKRHFSLSNYQLVYITDMCKKDLREQLIAIL